MREYLTINEACELAGIARRTFYRLLDSPQSGLTEVARRIPGMSRIRLPQREFREWLESAPAKPRTRKHKALS